MVFERYLMDALTTHFGHVLEGLDENQVRLSVWKGQVSLHNVRLKRHALDSILFLQQQQQQPMSSSSGRSTPTTTAPVEILHGHVGTLELSIPWRVLKNQLTASSSSDGSTTKPIAASSLGEQVSLVLTDVNILVTPRRQQQSAAAAASDIRQDDDDEDENDDDENENNNALHVRADKENQVQTALDSMLLRRFAESSASSSAESSSSASSSSSSSSSSSTTTISPSSSRWQWLQNRLTGLFANLSVTIRNIHIRYEDPGTSLGFSWTATSSSSATTTTRYRPAFCVGITLRQFDIHSIHNHHQYSSSAAATSTATTTLSTSQSTDSAVAENVDNASATAISASNSIDTTGSTDSTAAAAAPRIRQKRAAAKQLAVYWDSGAKRLMSQHQAELLHDDDDDGRDGVVDGGAVTDDDDFFKRAFANLNEMTQDFYAASDNNDKKSHDNDNDDEKNNNDNSGKISQPATPLVGRNDDFSLYNSPHHAFVLDPFSPCVLFQLVVSPSNNDSTTAAAAAAAAAPTTTTTSSSSDTAAATTAAAAVQVVVVPCSIQAHLPPCRLTLSRSLLEDVGYLRKSFAIWAQTVRHFNHDNDDDNFVSEATLQKLAQLRPPSKTSRRHDVFDAKAWWKYAYYAVLATLQKDDSSNDDNNAHSTQKQQQQQHTIGRRRRRRRHRPRGWLGVSQALADRRRYVDLYRIALQGNGQDDNNNGRRREEAHQALLDLEHSQLSIDEIVTFRIHVHATGIRYSSTTTAAGSKDDTCNENDGEEDFPEKESDAAVLMLEYRCRMFAEMTVALDRDDNDEEKKKTKDQQQQQQRVTVPAERYHGLDNCRNPVAWTTSITCPEVSLRVDDRRILYRHRDRPSPVVRVSCAFSSEQCLYLDGSWELTTRIGSLKVKDLTTTVVNRNNSSSRLFPLLVGPKRRRREGSSIVHDNDEDEEPPFYIDGVAHHGSLSLRIRRSQHAFQNPNRGSTTTTQVRVLPLEVCYATAPVEALSRILNTANLDVFLANDYHRLRTKLYEWRERSKQRLLAALSHKQKNIIVDINVGNPTILIPEKGDENSKRDGPLLVVDLGRLKVSNADEMDHETTIRETSGRWRVELASIQVQCSSTNLYRQRQSRARVQHVVEPFSLMFAISTRFGSTTKNHGHHVNGYNDNEHDSVVLVVATLPRLAFNFTSSAVRLIRSLRDEWNQRRLELQPSIQNMPTTTSMLGFATGTNRGTLGIMSNRSSHGSSSPHTEKGVGIGRKFEFRFMAPLLSLKLENDVDGRDCSTTLSDKNLPPSSYTTTPIVDLAFRGMEGNIVHETCASGGKRLLVTAKLRSVDALDLYQGAGDAYALLLSSIAPETMPGRTAAAMTLGTGDRIVDKHLSGTDLVSFDYISVSGGPILGNQENGPASSSSATSGSADKLKIRFHELFVEWNPETLAAIHKAINAPTEEVTSGAEEEAQSAGSDEFYDAEEDEFQEAGSIDPEDDEEDCPISEISSSRRSSQADLTKIPGVSSGVTFQSPIVTTHLLSPPRTLLSPWPVLAASPILAPDQHPPNEVNKPFEVSFELSKLRVNFNKESRHRRLVTAEMDRTSVLYSTRQHGGYNAKVSIGNLSFADADSAFNKTLYREIIGLKTDPICPDDNPSSLLEMKMVKNPRSRRYISGKEGFADPAVLNESVSVDVSHGAIRGCDCSLEARFSPMRFVYLQQLWFEIVDYFFEGIVGYEVWGNKRPVSVPVTEIRLGPSSDGIADNVSFTRFDVHMESPIILIPVTYCSTDFLRVEADRIAFSNRYEYQPMRLAEAPPESDDSEVRQQWFNNCSIRMENLIITSWSGTRLSQDPVTARIELNWPSGPTAPLNKPKWKVDCTFDELKLSLFREDYALLQNVISSNICEESRHLDEWHALQNLPRLVIERYKEDIMVHFGYDKKDVTPSTFDVTVGLPSLLFSLRWHEQSGVADLRCVDVVWKYLKLADLVSRQRVTCEAYIICQDGSVQTEMLSAQDVVGLDLEPMITPSLMYTSTTNPSGDNVKSLEIDDACIHVGYRPWYRLSNYFQSLPSPNFLSPDEVIQVGDRWYKIAGQSSKVAEANTPPQYRWMAPSDSRNFVTSSGAISRPDPSYEFHLRLMRPTIALESSDSALLLSINNVDLSHHGKSGLIERAFVLNEIKLQTRAAGQPMREPEVSLIHPLCISGDIRRCNGRAPCRCESHNNELDIGNISATAAFSDLTIAAKVYTSLLQDLKAFDDSKAKPSPISRIERTLSSSSILNEGNHEVVLDCGPSETNFRVTCKSINIAVVDDSWRHFAAAQELVIFSLGLLAFTRKDSMRGSWHSSLESGMGIEQSMTLCLDRLEIVDCLQSKASPFRIVASLTSSDVVRNRRGLSYGDEMSQHGTRGNGQAKKAVQLRAQVSANHSRYTVDLNTAVFQYNPSMIIALQRLLGRLRKNFLTVASKSQTTTVQTNQDIRTIDTSGSVLKASISVKSASLRLNKEHQGRSLLEFALSDSILDAERSQHGLLMKGGVGDLSVWDTDSYDGNERLLDRYRPVVKVSNASERFLEFRYQTFSKRQLIGDGIPEWVALHLQEECAEIDDSLALSIASIEVVYLSRRTKEVLDYMGNGLPGKGMGFTSRAAKGFVKLRIQKRSFLQVHVDAPLVIIPRRESEEDGLVFGGDVSVKSWVDSPDATRVVSLSLAGFTGGLYRGSKSANNILSDLNISMNMSRTVANHTKVNLRLSDVFARIAYTDYALGLLVFRDNIGRKVDRSLWDNLEVAWEEQGSVDSPRHADSLYSKEVPYAADARRVRYGVKKVHEDKVQHPRLDFDVHLEDLAVVLRRDDPAGTIVSGIAYDIMLFRGKGFEATFSSFDGGDSSCFSIRRILVLDLGGRGRMLRAGALELGEQTPSLVTVLAEGYTAPDRMKSHRHDDEYAQVDARVDRTISTSTIETNLSLVINHLSVAALIRPLQDLMGFLDVKVPSLKTKSTDESVQETTDTGDEPLNAASNNKIYQIRLVLHHPRFVFVAHEADPHSRALVLGGLAIVNGSYGKRVEPEEGSSELINGIATTVNADFQNIVSYILPDVSDMVYLQRRHSELVGDILPDIILKANFRDDAVDASDDADKEPADQSDDNGVALLLPVTVGIEFEQIARAGCPTNRSVAINMEPLSLMISSEDLQLITALNKKWRPHRYDSISSKELTYELDFHSDTLGLGLRKEGKRIVVDATREESMEAGDFLISINGSVLADVPLVAVVEQLKTEARPVRLGFARKIAVDENLDDAPEPSRVVAVRKSYIDSWDLSLTEATMTMLSNEVPILRGKVTGARLHLGRRDEAALFLRFSVLATLSIDYYHLRIWTWEPMLEPGSCSLSAEFSDPREGPKALAVEVGDGDTGPLSFNLTHACASALSKLQKWDTNSGNDTVDGGEPTRAANAALQFAKRQKSSAAKPYVFRNLTGVSCAFVIQRKEKAILGPRRSFVAVGDYNGLKSDDSPEIVAPGEETKFRLDRAAGSMRTDGYGRLPGLTVAFQAVAGLNIEALENLQIIRSGETLLPLSYTRTDASGGARPTAPVWVSWFVDISDEMTTLTLASTFRIASPLHTQIEIGIAMNETASDTVKSLGCVPKDNAGFCLPLWLCLRPVFRLFVRPSGGYLFSPLFECRSEEPGTISGSTEYIECRAKNEGQLSAWLAATNVRNGAVTVISIGCCLTVRNALPTSIEWETSTNILQSSCTIDGSTCRGMLLESGQAAEVMGGQHAATIHIRLRRADWSSWVALSLDKQGDSANTRTVSLKDIFGVPFVVGIRIARRAVGLEATLFSEMWFVNTTPMDISFGAPFEQVIGPIGDDSAASEQEVSAAEAALKEISSLFETGEEGTGIRQGKAERSTPDIVLLPGHAGTIVTEECFEYIDVENSVVKRRWWASENPNSTRKNLTTIEDDGDKWLWVDSCWRADLNGKTSDGWESAPNLWQFSNRRDFNSSHRFRRRRWVRKREIRKELVNAVYQRTRRVPPKTKSKSKPDMEQPDMQFAVQVNGGKWALTSYIPAQGVVYGAMRATSARWPQLKTKAATSTSVFELCYSISPLDQEWGELTRLFLVSSRFLLRNDSQQLTFEMKQVGSGDSTAVVLGPGAIAPFHWANFHLPELICTRPVVRSQGRSYFKWSGGFDPVTIGVVPLRIRKVHSIAEGSSYRTSIKSLKMEAEIRPGTGGTGINLSFVEEDEKGEGSLFRIDNFSPFPVWATQDGILANFSLDSVNEGVHEGDIVRSNERIPFALDVPFRQGKYAHRRAATIEELLKVRLALAPLNSRAGIETARLVSLSSVGSTVKLNPSKLMILDAELRSSLQIFRVMGIVTNDGPTRVLRLVLAKKEEIFPSFPNPFNDDVTMTTTPYCSTGKVGHFTKEIVAAARVAVGGHDDKNDNDVPHPIIKEEEKGDPARSTALVAQTTLDVEDSKELVPAEPADQADRDLIISFRMAFSGFILSLVDSSPAEIAVVTLKNVNTLATWNARRTTDSTIYITISHVQVDNMVPNAPYPVAVSPEERARNGEETDATRAPDAAASAPVLVVGLSFAPRHKSGIVILKSVTVAPRNLAVRVDLAFLVRLQKFALDIQRHFVKLGREGDDNVWSTPNINQRINNLTAAARSGVDCQKFYLGGLTILPCNIKLSVAPARALTPAEAAFEGEEAAAIHQAVRKGDVRLGDREALLGVKIGSRNETPLAVVRGVFKSIVVDALLRLDGASLDFAGVSLRNHIATRQQLSTHIGAHYMASLRQNVPALLGSLSALGNPVGLVRGLGDGVSDFVLEPVRGFQRSVQEMDASHLVDGVARGTLSLARHTVGGFAYSAAALAETFSKNMTVLTLDRRYAQKRDLGDDLRTQGGDINVALGLGSGVNKLAKGFLEGVTGVVRAPIRGAEKRGFEGFAKGIGKGLLGLLVKPIIGISDGFTDVMIGVKGSMDGAGGHGHFGPPRALVQIRPRRPLYGKDRAIRVYNMADAAASALMLRTRLGGEQYRSHVDMGDRVALLSVKRLLILGPRGDELLLLKYKHIESVEVRAIDLVDGSPGFGIIIILNTPRRNGSEVEVINCTERSQAVELCSHIQEARRMMASDVQIQSSTAVQSSPPRGGRGGGGGGLRRGEEDDDDDDFAVVTSPSRGGSKRV